MMGMCDGYDIAVYQGGGTLSAHGLQAAVSR